ncbi:hypothetical protein K450DRAFT_252734 [Umbelopsis ramanniana AG]|uniref:Phytochrome n=1 Tax=Umbelopsis ramanniana AG TaxID=1314678 RepID=A0AAD5E832_UMBRA|nr:uncharacterized protein K450DRAFT_252734 [Umbelopsis ramanniana AG]KAI8577345.1 hypothetical protein K450DRAFT_252734 [Umbelopsis ramanniana AG]
MEPDSENLISMREDVLHVKHEGNFVPCDQEPIHIPGAIQHHGALIALSLSNLKIEYLSDNTPDLIGLPHIQPNHLFELKSFKKLLSDYQRDRFYKHIDALRDASKVGPSSFVLELDTSIFYRSKRFADILQDHRQSVEAASPASHDSDIGYYSEKTESRASFSTASSTPSGQTTGQDDYLNGLWNDLSDDDDDSDAEQSINPHKRQFYCSMHKSQRNPNLLILELEVYNRLAEVAYDKFFFGLNTLVHTFETAKNIQDLCSLAVRYVQHVTSYERVMMYQFDEDWNGVVVAETLAMDSDAESYMGIHFPHTDIPKQARDLYLLNKSRYLCDRGALTSSLLQANGKGSASRSKATRPLDLTFCHLRAMSPVHLIYLKHMGVNSSMSLAVTVYGRLWGLICCHHMFALPVTFQARTACSYLMRQLAEQYWTGSRNASQKAPPEPTATKVNDSPADTSVDSPEDEYCSSCDERDYFDKSVAERLENLHIDVNAVKRQTSRSSSVTSQRSGKFRRRPDHDRRSTEDWARMYERFVRVAGPTVCKLFGADYMLFMIQGRSIVVPNPALIPDPDALTRFVQYLQSVRLKKTVVSSCIAKDFQGMESTRALSGAIYFPLSDDGIDFAVICRQEQIMNVTWAGEPMKSGDTMTIQAYNGRQNDVLMPRTSFQKWTETIEGTSSSWSTHVNPELLLTTLSVFQESLKTWKNRMLRIDGREARYRNSQLEQAKRLAEESDKKKSLLLANVSHEVRTPLHGISGVINLLLDTDLSSEQSQMLQEANQATKTLTTIINDLLDFSKLERGEVHLEKASFNLEDAISDVTQSYAPRFKEKNLGFFVKFDPSLPKWAIGDVIKIKQILRNFVSNACKYTSKGEVSVNVSLIEVHEDGNISVKVGVTDTGIGIPIDRQQLIFEKFVQGDDSLSRNNGGIGLAVSHTLAHLMGGKVGLVSKPEIGSEFYLELPLEPVDQHPDSTVAPTNGSDTKNVRPQLVPTIPIPLAQTLPAHTKDELIANFSSPTEAISPYPVMNVSEIESILAQYEGAHRPFRVLCVEDNKLNQALICRMMQKLKYVYEVADNGQEAIDIYVRANTTKSTLQKDSFDVILMDLQMPICDGFEATRQILEYQRHTFGAAVIAAPIIAVTAQAMSGDREICLSKGMKGYVSKPIDFQVLRQLLEGLRCQKLVAETGSPSLEK